MRNDISAKNVLVVLHMAFFCFALFGCGRQTKDKLLSVFFDGVYSSTEQDAVVAQKESKKEAATIKKIDLLPAQQKPTTYFHPPFIEKQCDNCHESKFSQRLVAKGKELCFSCHDDFLKGKKSVHYPAEEGECLACHEQHQSVNKKLLKKPVPLICFTCHDEKDIRAIDVHEGQNVCTDCHSPHASNDEKLLK